MILEMHDICKDYPMGKSVSHVLKNVDLTVDEREYLAIMGPSGSGKSTLMNLIGCLDVPTSGSYFLSGKDITSCNHKELADIRNKEIGFVFQQYHLLPKLTAEENVALPLLYGGMKKAERLNLARQALEKVGLGTQFTHYPEQMSGGQCQRVAIARAIVGHPKLLLADEPTGALDSTNGEAVMDLFRQLHDDGSTIIMITHDANIANHAEKVYTIRDGILTTGGSGK